MTTTLTTRKDIIMNSKKLRAIALILALASASTLAACGDAEAPSQSIAGAAPDNGSDDRRPWETRKRPPDFGQ